MLGFPTFQHLQIYRTLPHGVDNASGSVEDAQGVMDVGDLEHCPPEEPAP